MRYTNDDLRSELAVMVQSGGLRKVARQIGVSPTLVSQIVRGRTLPGPTVAAHLGYVDDGQRWIKRPCDGKRKR